MRHRSFWHLHMPVGLTAYTNISISRMDLVVSSLEMLKQLGKSLRHLKGSKCALCTVAVFLPSGLLLVVIKSRAGP